jgi:hypothetical protein
MRKLQWLLTTAAAAIALVGTSAHADTLWNFTYAGTGVSASGSFTTVGNGSTPSLVNSMSGTYTDGSTSGAITLIPIASGTPTYAPDGLYIADNLFGGSPQIDVWGLLFLAGTQEVNVYTDPSQGLLSTTSHGGYVFTPITFNAVAVPEPASVAMLLAGLGALAFTSRRRARA